MVGDTWLSGILFADDFVGMPDTGEGLEMRNADWRFVGYFADEGSLPADVKSRAAMVPNEDIGSLVDFDWR